MNLFFDTETTGLIPKGAKWDTDYNIFPHIVQLAWKCSDEDKVRDYIIKPDGWVIPEESIKIHGITNEKALTEGVDLCIPILYFMADCVMSNKIIGHNIYFDVSIIKANMLRLLNDDNGINAMISILHKEKRIDTMRKSIKLCNLKQSGNNRIKFPTLPELYYKLFNDTFDAHNAKYDVIATERCYNRLVEIGIII